MRLQTFYTKHGGPGVFMRRLEKYIVSHFDVKLVERKPDVYLSAVWRGDPPRRCKIVHRVDNVYFDELNPHRKKLNRKIAEAINKSDAVIFQSVFAKNICYHQLRLAKSFDSKFNRVIYNAIDQGYYQSIKGIEHDYEYLFIACAKWRPLKRPRAIAKGFLGAGVPSSKLIFIGDISKIDRIKSSSVNYIGSRSSDETIQYYSSSFGLIHIARLDACPNVVVEALSLKKPVICNNAGGAPELVGKDGVIVNIDPIDNFAPFKMKKPESIDIGLLSEAIMNSTKVKWNINRPEFDMSFCAKQYYNLFIDLLS